MPSPVAHALAGYCLFRAEETRFSLGGRAAALFILFSLLPDAHYLPALFSGDPFRVSPPFLHSVLAALTVAAMIFAGLKAAGRAGAAFWAINGCALYAAHLAMDWASLNEVPDHGPMLFWPFSERMFTAPVHVFRDLQKGSLSVILGRHNMVQLLKEVVVMTASLGIVLAAKRSRAKGSSL